MSITYDPNDPRLGKGEDTEPIGQHPVYLALSPEERAKGFVRPVRTSYVHVGRPGPTYALLDLTDEQKANYGDCDYVKYEKYPFEKAPALGRYWTQAELDNIGKGCGGRTTMNIELAETYARNPHFYGATFCVHCGKHLGVGEDGEFVWEDDTRVGT